MKNLPVFFVFLLLCFDVLGENSDSKKPSIMDIQLKVKKYTLSNGLRLLIYENRQLPLFSFQTFFDVGGRHESSGTTGATHFLEHMMFKGSKNFGPGVFDTTIERNGGNNNAYTSFDSTVYYENLPSSNRQGEKLIDKIIDLEADRMSSLLLESKSFEAERNVILDERKSRYENSPAGKLWLALTQNIFSGTPYGGSVIGDIADLKSLKRDQVMDFFNKFYTPDNAVIVIAGDVDSDRVYRMIKKKYGDMKASSPEIRDHREKRDNPNNYTHRATYYNREIHLHAENPIPMFMLAFPGVKIGERLGFIYDVLGSILGNGESSYLYQSLVKGKKPILNSISAGSYSLRYNGVVYLYGELRDRVGLKTAKRKVLKMLKRSCDKAISERSLQKTKNQILKGYFASIQTNSGVASFLGEREHFYRDYEYYKKEMDIYQGINVSDVRDACLKLFSTDKHIYLTAWKKNPKKK